MIDSAKIADTDQNVSLRMYHALTADKEELFSKLQGQPVEVLLSALRNLAFDERHLLALMKQRDLPEEVFTTLYANKSLIESNRVKFALISNPEIPAHIAAALLPGLTVFELLKISLMPGITPDQRLSAERVIIQRIPTQPLGNKMTLARRGTSAIVESLLREGLPPLVEACLDNPRLKEGAVHQFITSHTSTAETISMVARNGRWKGRPNIRLAILKNPRTPTIWYNLLLPGLPQNTIRELLSVPRLSPAQKGLVRQALDGHRSTL
ncbi:MAG: hypothetical protein M0023_08205 [Desulfobacteraceae bacterium]|nr:hypothetical protein [Desulfobacteraceae bacterium]